MSQVYVESHDDFLTTTTSSSSAHEYLQPDGETWSKACAPPNEQGRRGDRNFQICLLREWQSGTHVVLRHSIRRVPALPSFQPCLGSRPERSLMLATGKNGSIRPRFTLALSVPQSRLQVLPPEGVRGFPLPLVSAVSSPVCESAIVAVSPTPPPDYDRQPRRRFPPY